VDLWGFQAWPLAQGLCLASPSFFVNNPREAAIAMSTVRFRRLRAPKVGSPRWPSSSCKKCGHDLLGSRVTPDIQEVLEVRLAQFRCTALVPLGKLQPLVQLLLKSGTRTCATMSA
jgi:hypothetical protein